MSTTILDPSLPTPSTPEGPPGAPSPPGPLTLTSSALFRTWLMGLGENAICGRRGSPTDCPLARFLDGLNSVEESTLSSWERKASVGTFSYDVGVERYMLPSWAKRFVRQVDGPLFITYHGLPAVTAAAALALLDKVDEKGGA